MADSFKDVIEQHLELKRRNGHLEATLSLENYQPEPASVTHRTPAVFEAEAEGAAFNTTDWNSNTWSENQGDHAGPQGFDSNKRL
jgi:hypothetical protein